MAFSSRFIRFVYLRACREVLARPSGSFIEEHGEDSDNQLVCRAVFDMLLDCAGGMSASGMEHLWIRATFAREQAEGRG